MKIKCTEIIYVVPLNHPLKKLFCLPKRSSVTVSFFAVYCQTQIAIVTVIERHMFLRLSDFSSNEQVPAQLDSDFETEAELPPLDSFISKDFLKKLKPKEKKWHEVVNGKYCVL